MWRCFKYNHPFVLTYFSFTMDGFCEFDSDRKILYYATNTDSTFLFRVGMSEGFTNPMAPISFNAKKILSINYDPRNLRVIVTFITDENDRILIASSSTELHGDYSILKDISSKA